jgi:elongation factor P--(R)-beta-lysine ligase
VLSPSDLGRLAVARRIRVGGRVASAQTKSAVIADALGAIRTEFAAPVALGAGDLVVVEGRLARGRLTRATLIEHHVKPPPRADGEFARLAWHSVGPRLAARATALDVIRSYFRGRRFLEVDTPLRVPAPGLDLHVDAVRAEGAFLITSPEHHMKRLLAGGLPRIFQLVHASRAGERGALHEPEFMMLEWYRAFSDREAVMRDTEQLVSRVVRALSGGRHARVGDRRIDVTPPYPRIGVARAFRRYAGVADAVTLAEHDEDRFFELLVERVEPALARMRRPVFLCDYPIAQASLARALPTEPRLADRFELYAGGVELCNGFGELTDPVEQRRRFRRDRAARRKRSRPAYPIDERLIAALDEGLPPSGGNALGVDRLIALALGAERVADVQAFPADRI